MERFIGRRQELRQLQDLNAFRRACLVVMRGRRRIGKSRLVTEFAKGKRFLQFSGLAPDKKIKPQDQLNTFAQQLAQNFSDPTLNFTDWSDAFTHLSNNLTDQPTIILFDEISWMGSKDRTFISKLKIWWD